MAAVSHGGPAELRAIDAYGRAANYLSVRRIYLYPEEGTTTTTD
jgi:hypothetical protein